MKLFARKQIVLLFATMLLTQLLFSQVTLSPLFTDNMVLQQNSNASIWGEAKPKSNIKIKTSWDKKEYITLADNEGKWKVEVKTPGAGGPYNIKITSNKSIILNNVLIGEVWLCSGQSNMEMPLAGWGEITNYKSEIANANYPNIRLLQVKKATSNKPLNSFEADADGWMECTSANIPEFSAVAYFFGRELNKNLDIPIGLIHTSWGGTPAESWVSESTLSNMPEYIDRIKDFKSLPEDPEEQNKLFEEIEANWYNEIEARDFGIQDGAVAAQPNLDEGDWETATIPGFWEYSSLPSFDGIVWYRKTLNIPKEWSGKDLLLSLGAIDDNDITFFNGVEVGKTEGFFIEREYIISKDLVKEGKATIAVRVTDTGGDGGFNSDKEKIFLSLNGNSAQKIIIAGDWRYKASVDITQIPRKHLYKHDHPHNPTTLYNAMIAPLVPYSVKGAIWYQGESNADRAYQYRTLFPLMIEDWRTQWQTELPFYFVQLANFMQTKTEPAESEWAELREAQLQTLRLNNTGMAVSIDIGDATDIHPKNKQDVGKRLALGALKKTYNLDITHSGPIYKSYKIENGTIRIFFEESNSPLFADGNKLTGFSIAGPDMKFHWAEAVIDGNEVVVSSPDIQYPVAVRYGWADNPVCNLYNEAKLPASPFRTDDWSGLTINKK